MIGTKLKVSSY